MQDQPDPNQTPVEEPPHVIVSPDPARKRKVLLIAVGVVVVLAGIGVGAFFMLHTSGKPASQVTAGKQQDQTDTSTKQATAAQGLTLDTAKNYGDKYASGIVPVGDSKYTTDSAKQGYIYTCSQYAQNIKSDNGGASTRGPWFTNNNTQYDLTKKVHIQGSVVWKADFSIKESGSTRTIVTNGLPSHPTGSFPVASSDPAYAYDRNPNSIKGQTFTYSLPLNPTYGTPQCMGGDVGVMLTGIPLFNGFDAGGRDAGAWEVQDGCSGHPQSSGEYHYHTLSSCIKDISVHTVIGYALDGFPITGPQVGDKNFLTTADLDECHGLTSSVTISGKTVTTYHYVMTQDFPYSVSCFRATATQSPGMQGGQTGTQTGQGGQQTPPPNQQPGQNPPPPKP